jgi:hypothetical protein
MTHTFNSHPTTAAALTVSVSHIFSAKVRGEALTEFVGAIYTRNCAEKDQLKPQRRWPWPRNAYTKNVIRTRGLYTNAEHIGKEELLVGRSFVSQK